MEAKSFFEDGSFGECLEETLRNVVKTTQKANGLLFDESDYDFYSTLEGFKAFTDHHSTKILKMMEEIRKHQKLMCGPPHSGDDIDELDDWLTEANDCLLEEAGSLMDDVCGLRTTDSSVVSKAVAANTSAAIWNRTQGKNVRWSLSHLHAKNLARPQLQFKDRIDNSSRPFVHRLCSKPNALEPLAGEDPVGQLMKSIRNERAVYKSKTHPYHMEIDSFEPTKKMLSECKPQMYKSLEETELLFITSESQMLELAEELLKQEEFAVDLEHHSYRSYQGFTCLMQISTRKRDYIIDTLLLREHIHVLNDPFTKPSIVKVFHGADSDVKWLQRDFGVYIVNLFDTHQAACALQLPQRSLAFLLFYYCQIEIDKQYQLADWRIRPLPEEMLKYAREDTHYLLFVYDKIRNHLILTENKLLLSVFLQSKAVSLKVYVKPQFRENEYPGKVRAEIDLRLNARQIHAVKLLYAWRNSVARDQDESIGYVLPTHMLLQIAQFLPREPERILACCSPVPPLVRQHLLDIHRMVVEARSVSLSLTKATARKEDQSSVTSQRSRDDDEEDSASTQNNDAQLNGHQKAKTELRRKRSKRKRTDDESKAEVGENVKIVKAFVHQLMSAGPPVVLKSPTIDVWEKS
eukprot:m.65841 g.65841  ORF g.65841 m.65841 type:complete len:634 (+) comp35333_c1_seq5:330-2231(+)